MSVSKVLLKDSLPAGADLTGALFKFVKVNTSGQLVLPGTSGDQVYGVVSEVPASSATGSATTVDIVGIVKVEAGATVATGANVMANAAGEAITATAGEAVAGICRKGGDDGEIIEVLLVHNFNTAA